MNIHKRARVCAFIKAYGVLDPMELVWRYDVTIEEAKYFLRVCDEVRGGEIE